MEDTASPSATVAVPESPAAVAAPVAVAAVKCPECRKELTPGATKCSCGTEQRGWKRALAFAFWLAAGLGGIAGLVKLVPPVIDYISRAPKLKFVGVETDTGLVELEIKNPTGKRLKLRSLKVNADTQLLSHLKFKTPTIVETRAIAGSENSSLKLTFASIIGSPHFLKDSNAFISAHAVEEIDFVAVVATDDGKEMPELHCTVPLNDLRVFLLQHATTDRW